MNDQPVVTERSTYRVTMFVPGTLGMVITALDAVGLTEDADGVSFHSTDGGYHNVTWASVSSIETIHKTLRTWATPVR